MRDIDTDLAMEACQHYKKELPQKGVRVTKRQKEQYTVTFVEVCSRVAARLLKKEQGQYITIDFPPGQASPGLYAALAGEAARCLKKLLGGTAGKRGLVVGLGNRELSPDALGCLTVERLLVTRHYFQLQIPPKGAGNLSAFCPGVFGATGIESAEAVKALVKKLRPDYVITVDALSARSIKKVYGSIQLSNTGISPGAGVGNLRTAINQKTLSVPVIAVGVPTVVHARTLLYDLAEEAGTPLPDAAALLQSGLAGLVVTPKEVDRSVRDCARILADGLNRALHPGLTQAGREELLFWNR